MIGAPTAKSPNLGGNPRTYLSKPDHVHLTRSHEHDFIILITRPTLEWVSKTEINMLVWETFSYWQNRRFEVSSIREHLLKEVTNNIAELAISRGCRKSIGIAFVLFKNLFNED